MAKTLGDICIAAMVKLYLLSIREMLIESCVHGCNQGMLNVAKLSDCLG
jgi:hypothetical protein